MIRIRRSVLLALTLVAAIACGDDPAAPDPRNTTFAPGLDIDLNRMTRTASGLWVEDVAAGAGPTATAGRSASGDCRVG